MTSLTSSLSSLPLPGFLFRPTLPAGFIPTSVATGDFNGDGRLDWVVANGGDNNLWLYLGNGDGTSQLPTIIPLAGRSPVAVAAADLRGNGTMDLIVAEADSQTVGVLLGDGHGGFSPEVKYTLPAPPLSLLVRDFNGDGHPDIVVGLEGTLQIGSLAYLQGNGDGTFGLPITSPGPANYANPTVVQMAAADLNGDNLPDIVTRDPGYGISIHLNAGNGKFDLPQPGPTPNGPYLAPTNIALGDVNHDGCADLVVLDTWGRADRFLGDCKGNFQDFSTYRTFGMGEVAYGIGLADVNHDGNLDIVASGFSDAANLPGGVGQQSGHLVSVLLGDGKGIFSPPTLYRGEPGMYSLAVADLKGDGYPDIITANQDTDSVSVYKNDGHGGFGPPQGGYVGYDVNGVIGGAMNTPILSVPVIAKDVNDDGKPDLSILEGPGPSSSCGNCDNLGVLLNKGNGIFGQVIHSDIVSTTSINIGDLALDNFRNTGLLDLLAIGNQFSMGSPLLSFAPNDGNGTFGPAATSAPAGTQGLLGVGDFNGDGNLDFVAVGSIPGSAANSNSSVLTVFLGNGAGGFTPGYQTQYSVNSNVYPGRVFVGDFNGDGKADVLVLETNSLGGTMGHDVYEFLGNGDGTFAPPKIVLTDSGPIAVGDLNHDGRPDIVEQVEPLTTLPLGLPVQYAIYLCQPDGSFKLFKTYEPYAGTVNMANFDLRGPILADFNGDGNLDILVYQSPAGNGSGYEPGNYFQILAGNGDGTFTPTYSIFEINTQSSPQYAADVTGNGRADLIERDGDTSSYQVIPAVPGPAFQIHLVSDPVVGSSGNVQIDLALASSSSTTINLSASDPAITLPSSVTIPAGSVSQDVPFQIGSTFNPNHVFSIQGQLGTETETAYGTQGTNSAGIAVNLINKSFTVAGGQTTPDYTLSVFSAGGYSTTVQLHCTGLPAGASCQFGDNTIVVPSGSSGQTTLTVATLSSLAAGTYPFTVVATDGSVTGQTSGSVVVQQAPALQISPASLTFPMQTIGTTSAPQTVTVTNSGGATMTLSISAVSGSTTTSPSYAETNNCGGSLPAGQSCTVNITFTPTLTGSVDGALQIDANILGATRQDVDLSGTAEGALVKLSTSSLNFNTPLYVGQTSAAQTVTVWNDGTVPIDFSGITDSGADASDFDVAPGPDCAAGGQLGVGLGCTISVTFVPSVSGTLSATLSVADSVSSSPQAVSLGGIANAADFTIGPASGTSASATVTAGGTATYTLAVAPLGAFSKSITLTCPGAPLGGTCSVSPTSVTFNGSNSQNVKVTVTTTASSLAAPRGPVPPAAPPTAPWVVFIGLIAFGLLAWQVSRRASFGSARLPGPFNAETSSARSRCVFALGMVLLAVTLWVSCGGGGGSTSASSSPATPAGNYAMTVAATAGSLSHSVMLTLDVK